MRGRLKPQTLGGAVYLVVVALAGCGLLVLSFGPWRRGVAMIGATLVAAAGVRMFLSDDNAGMLRVRGRLFDVTALAGVGVTMIVLAANIPDQPAL